jgi:ankyrin repeat protein
MKISRKEFWGLSILLLGVPPLFITGGLICRGYRQQSVNRLMITAIKRNDLPKVVALLAQGADPNAREWPLYTDYIWENLWGGRYSSGQSKTALMLTMELNTENIPLVKTLLDAGASVDAANEFGSTDQNRQIIKILTDAGEKK